MKKIIATLLALTLVFVGCGKEEKNGKKAYEDYKVISLSPSITDDIIGLGMEDNLIAVDTWSTFEEVKDLPMVDAYTINAEEILKLDPTHIFVSDYNFQGDKKSDYDVFIDQGIEIIPVAGANNIEEIYEGIDTIGKALDNTEASDKLIKDTKAEVERIVNKYDSKETKTVYMEIAPAPEMYAAGNNTFANDMIKLVGGENVFEKTGEGYFMPSVENIIQLNPEIIITSVDYVDNPTDEIIKRDGFKEITAVKNNDVYTVSNTSQPSHNFTVGLEEIAKAIHNEK